LGRNVFENLGRIAPLTKLTIKQGKKGENAK
jgi:hypothetical protein